MSATDEMDELKPGISNCELSVPPQLEAELRARANECFVYHCAWNFCGRVYFDGTRFVEEIRRHRKLVNELYGDTLAEVIEQANDEYGDD